MDLIIDKDEFINNYFNQFFSNEFVEKQVIEYRDSSLEILKNIEKWTETLVNIIYGYKTTFIEKEVPKLETLVSCKTVEDLENEISDFSLGAMRISGIDDYTKLRASFLRIRLRLLKR